MLYFKTTFDYHCLPFATRLCNRNHYFQYDTSVTDTSLVHSLASFPLHLFHKETESAVQNTPLKRELAEAFNPQAKKKGKVLKKPGGNGAKKGAGELEPDSNEEPGQKSKGEADRKEKQKERGGSPRPAKQAAKEVEEQGSKLNLGSNSSAMDVGLLAKKEL